MDLRCGFFPNQMDNPSDAKPVAYTIAFPHLLSDS